MVRCVFLIFSILFFGACSPSPEEGGVPSDKPQAVSPTIEHGKQLFFGKCSSCHMVNKELTGPALKGAEDRWPDQQKLYAFIRNSDSVIKVDAYAKGLWLQYNQTMMTMHPDLTDEDIKAILEYVKWAAK